MADTIYGRVFDASTTGWIADLMVSVSAPTGVYVKESSLGADFTWSGGLLEVSINATDTSVAELYTYVEDLSTLVHTQDSSIPILFIKDSYQDVSIALLDANKLEADDLYPYTTNASIGLAGFAKQSNVDSSLNEKLNKTTDTFTGVLTVDGSLLIFGNIYLDGSSYVLKTSNLDVSNNFITLRDGAAVQLPDGSIAGLRILKADGTNTVVFGTANDAILRIGWENDTLQAIATREDAPTNAYYAYWDDSSSMFKTFDLKGYVDGSLNAKQPLGTYVKEASLGSDLVWTAGKLDVSIVAMDYGYIDGSLLQRDNSIAWLNANKQAVGSYVTGAANESGDARIFDTVTPPTIYARSLNASEGIQLIEAPEKIYIGINTDIARTSQLTGLASQTYVQQSLYPYATNASVGLALGVFATNSSIGLAGFITVSDVSNNYAKRYGEFSTANSNYLVSSSDNNNFILADVSSLIITFPDTLSAGFSTVVINETTGICTLNASTLLSTDSSIVLRDRYAAATIICKSAGVFIAAGNLK